MVYKKLDIAQLFQDIHLFADAQLSITTERWNKQELGRQGHVTEYDSIN